jgi:FXSXX-COOH protein
MLTRSAMSYSKMGNIMAATDVKDRELTSDVADLREVPLENIPLLDTETLDSAVRRLIPDSVARPVPVAAFNSAI